MLRRLTILMTLEEHRALEAMAQQQLRSPRAHLRFLIQQEAARHGLLATIGEMQRAQLGTIKNATIGADNEHDE